MATFLVIHKEFWPTMHMTNGLKHPLGYRVRKYMDLCNAKPNPSSEETKTLKKPLPLQLEPENKIALATSKTSKPATSQQRQLVPTHLLENREKERSYTNIYINL